MSITEQIYSTVIKIPKGKVSTYGAIAEYVGTGPRVVGNALHKNPASEKTPCHRVVNSQGRLAPHYAFGGIEVQTLKLKDEGVLFRNGKVDLKKSLWQPN